jgi:sirohydrochlorin cobaltochelatase
MADANAALIVFGHGSRDPLWAETLKALRERLSGALPDAEVELAYLEFLKPTLGECVDALWQRGCRDIAVFPAFVGEGAHLRRELPELVERARSDRAGLSIKLLPAMGDLPEVQEGVVRFVQDKFPR